jgi:hypothetical protein
LKILASLSSVHARPQKKLLTCAAAQVNSFYTCGSPRG